jgi:hypothetical protein
MRKRPISVTIISCVYILAGTVGLIYHARELTVQPIPYGALGIEFVRLLAIVAGAFMLRGANWARWLAIAWIAFHVVVGYLHGWAQFATHAAMFVVITFFLVRVPANEYFLNNPTQPTEG